MFLVMMVLMIVAAAVSVLVFLVMMVLMIVAAAVSILVFLVMMVLMIVAVAVSILVFLVMMRAMRLLHFLQIVLHARLSAHRVQQLFPGQLVPRSRHQRGVRIMLAQQRNGRVQLCLRDGIRAGEDDRPCGFDLIVVKLAEVFHIHLDLARIHDRDGKAQRNIFVRDLFHGGLYIGELAHAGRLNDDAVGMILFDHLRQCLAKVTHQTATNTAGVHFRNIDARILQKSAVDADLTEFVLDQHQLLTAVGFADHLFDQCSFSRSEKSGVNVDFCHTVFTPSKFVFTRTAYAIVPAHYGCVQIL